MKMFSFEFPSYGRLEASIDLCGTGENGWWAIDSSDEEKLSTVADLSCPIAKRDVRRTLDFFSYFRPYIPYSGDLTRVLSGLTAKNKPTNVL